MTVEETQHKHLKELIHYVAAHSVFYKTLFKTHNIRPEEIKSIEDLQKIPFTTKEDLQDKTEAFICVPKNKLIDYVTTSGTTGKPLTLALTDSDLDRLALNESSSFKIAGITEDDIIQLMTTADRRFMAGMAYFLGARKLGAGIVRVGNGIPALQWETINEVKPTVIIAVPSFILQLIEFAEANQIDIKNTSVKKAVCIGEAIRNPDFTLNALGRKIADKWPIHLYSTYASSEMATAFTECEAFNGGHLQPELLITEIINDMGQAVKPGEAGELVVTTLGTEGMPLIRFKTGDVCIAHTEPCKCGRNSLRLSPVLGRKKQMIKYKGTSFYPNALYEVLETINGITNYQVEVFTNELGTDEIKIRIGVKDPGSVKQEEFSDLFRAKLRVVPALDFVVPETVERLLFAGNPRKPLKFIDHRHTKNYEAKPHPH